MKPPARHILMTTDAVGGVWTFATSLARALCQTGDRVTLITLGPAPRAEQLEPLARVKGLNIEITDLALEWMDPEGDDLHRATHVLRRLIARHRPDLVHLNSFREATSGFETPTLVTAHSCVGSWWSMCRFGAPIDARWQVYLRNVAAGLNAADCWVAPTVAYRDWTNAVYGPRTKGHAVWNGADLPDSIGRKEPFILAAGRLWDEAKNLAALDAIADDLLWEVRVAGPMLLADGAPRATISSNIVHLGQLSHNRLLATMQSAAVFAAPALYEPFGLSVLEAANCGCALVLSDIPTFRELWEDAALFIKPTDTAALQTVLQDLATNPAVRTRLQRAARKRAKRYSLAGMLSDYSRLYDAMPEAALPPRAAMEMHA
jgi:glycosyltransferase involved in cell wall biosynthesis